MISVIIATCNRSESLKKVLQNLLAQPLSRPFDYEIIVVDNNSTDNTHALIDGMMLMAHGRLKYFQQPMRGKCQCLNMGIKKAKGDIIAFTDDDVIVENNWLSAIAECFEQFDCDGIGGKVLPVYPENTPMWIKENPGQLAGVVVIYDQGDMPRPVDGTIERFIGSNWAFKRSVFDELGLFRIDLGPGTPIMGEDEEFYFRILAKKKLYYCPQMLIRHPVDLSRLSFKKTAAWHISLGRFLACKQMRDGAESYVCYFGIPRYLFKDAAVNIFKLVINPGNRLAFWNAYRKFFCNIGMIQQYCLSKGRKIDSHAQSQRHYSHI